jgi:hypothetical protein
MSARTGEYSEAPAACTSHPAILDFDECLMTRSQLRSLNRALNEAQMIEALHFHALDHLAACEVLLDGRVRRLGGFDRSL